MEKEIIKASKEFSQNTFSIRPELVEDSFIQGAKIANKLIIEKICDIYCNICGYYKNNNKTIFICRCTCNHYKKFKLEIDKLKY